MLDPGPADRFMDGIDESLSVKGLKQEGAAATVADTPGKGSVCFARYEDYGRTRSFTVECVLHFDPGHAWHLNIGDNAVNFLILPHGKEGLR